MENDTNFTPTFKDLTSREITDKEWALYYKNIWKGKMIARVIDMQVDRAAKEKDSTMQIMQMDGSIISIGERLEFIKLKVQDSKKIFESAEKLLAKTSEEIAKLWSEDSLKVDEDMLPEIDKNMPQNIDITPDAEQAEPKKEIVAEEPQEAVVAEVVSTPTNSQGDDTLPTEGVTEVAPEAAEEPVSEESAQVEETVETAEEVAVEATQEQPQA